MKLSKQDKADLRDGGAVFASHSLVALLCVLLTFWIASSAVEDLNQSSVDNAMERAGRLYSMVVTEQWDDTAAVEETLTFLRDSERGLVDAWLVNDLAGVVSPLDKAYQILKDPELDKLLNEDEVGDEPVIVDDRVYVPIKNNDDSLKGVLILKFSDFWKAQSLISGASTIGLIIFGIVVAILLAAYSLLRINRPWRALLIKAENSLDGEGDAKLQRPSLDAVISTREKHQLLYYRLLAKVHRS